MSIDVGAFAHVVSQDRPQYLLGVSSLGYAGLDVVRFHAVEEISRPYRVGVTAVRSLRAGPLDLSALVGRAATLSVAGRDRWRPLHGIVADAQRVGHTADLIAYELVLVPSIYRASLRTRCRTFVDQTLRDVIVTVLENRSLSGDGPEGLAELQGEPSAPPVAPAIASFSEPRWTYRFAVADESRLRHGQLRSYVVQYNETDLDFLSRLLEEEGLSYFFEPVADGVVMTITDRPGSTPLFPSDIRSTTRAVSLHQGFDQEFVTSISERASLGPTSVTMRDFAWPRSRTMLEARAASPGQASAGADHFRFPARDEAVTDRPCEAPAHVAFERFAVERQLARGAGTVRTLTPGYRWQVHDFGAADHDVLVVSVESWGEQLELPDLALAPFPEQARARDGGARYSNRFVVLPMATRFRPARSTIAPRIDGVQTALVTAEEHGTSTPEVNADAYARVRVRFPWDQNPPGNRPSSMWIRVSQGWAGAAFGAHYTPRVGHEVLVAYLQGDPERPVIVGRVYNAQTPPPYDAAARPAVSTLKSQSTPGGNGFNELRFDDSSGNEEVFLHAQKDLVEEIENDHTTKVGHDQTLRVQRNQRIQVQGSRSLSVGGTRTTTIVGDDTDTVTRGSRKVDIQEGDLTVVCPNGKVRIDTGPGFIEMEDDCIVLDSGLGAKIRIGGNVVHIDATAIYLNTPDGAKVILERADVEVGGTNIMAIANERMDLNAGEMAIAAHGVVDVHGNPIKLNCD